jgi:RNA methyltransferase, TrmH family
MALRLITSRQNEIYRFLKALTEPHTRKKHKAFLLEGATFVAEALEDEAWAVLMVALTPEFSETERGQRIISEAQRKRVQVVLMAPALFEEISGTETPQGVIAAVRQPQAERLERLKIPTVATALVLEGLQDPSNVGAVVRVADAVGALAVLYTKGTADPYAPKAVRASAGSLLHVPVVPVNSVSEAVNWLKANEFQIVGTVPEGGKAFLKRNLETELRSLLATKREGFRKKRSAQLICRSRSRWSAKRNPSMSLSQLELCSTKFCAAV